MPTLTLESFIYENVSAMLEGKYETQKSIVEQHKNVYRDDTAICFILLGLGAFVNKDYDTFYQFMNDAFFLLSTDKNPLTLILHEMVMGYVDYVEKNIELYHISYSRARKLAIKSQNADFFDKVNSILDCPPIAYFTGKRVQGKDPLIALVKVGQAVAAEKNIDILIKTIAEETKTALNADRCTIYLYDKETDELYSKVATGLEIKELRMPADKGLAGHVLQTGDTINIKDAYKDERFNYEVDKNTGYRTRNMLCMPIKNFNQEIIGVFQVINKFDDYFTTEDEDILIAIASSAGISLENAQLFERQRKLLEEQKTVLDSFIETLSTSIDARDKITSGHSLRVKMYSSIIAQEFGMSKNEIYVLEKAAALHDIGKIGIKDSVLQKEGKLTDEEYKHIQQHVEITHNILEKIHMSKDFQQITEIACSHHEKYDGTGYYRHLKGEEIPFGGRILAVSDVFDAITSKRHYRDKMPIVKVIDIIKEGSGTHFDPKIVDKFLHVKLNKIVEVFCTESKLKMTAEDSELLGQYSLLDLYDSIVNNCNNKLVLVFYKYYVGIDAEHG